MTFKDVLNRMLEQIPAKYDRREGSFFATVLSPVAYVIAQCYEVLSWAVSLVYPDTATGNFLDLSTSAFGLTRKPATKARRKALAVDSDGEPLSLAVGERLGKGGVLFTVIEATADGGVIEALEAGSGPGLLTGELLPMSSLSGLGGIQLGEMVEPGADPEEDAALRERFWASAREQPFGGNPADYRQRTLALEGVGACTVFRTWAGEGTVKLVIGDSQGKVATAALLERIQAYYGDPEVGGGSAPVGHRVTVVTGTPLLVNLSAKLQLAIGSSFSVVEPQVQQKLADYLEEISFGQGTVYLAQVTVAALSVEGVLDIADLRLNGSSGNLQLSKTADSFQLPVVGAIALEEVAN